MATRPMPRGIGEGKLASATLWWATRGERVRISPGFGASRVSTGRAVSLARPLAVAVAPYTFPCLELVTRRGGRASGGARRAGGEAARAATTEGEAGDTFAG